MKVAEYAPYLLLVVTTPDGDILTIPAAISAGPPIADTGIIPVYRATTLPDETEAWISPDRRVFRNRRP